MAAHTLTIINSTLNKEITEAVCEQIEFACGHARGMDIPLLSQPDWNLIYEAAKTRVPKMLQTALEHVEPRVRYQDAYRNVEHVLAGRKFHVRFKEEGWEHRSASWYELTPDQHRTLARAVDARGYCGEVRVVDSFTAAADLVR
jgi:hypothetical protein